VTLSNLIQWQPVAAPAPVVIEGRTVLLEPLRAEKHTGALWGAVRGHDALWDWLADGPYAEESGLRQSLAQKETGRSALFFALIPKSLGTAAGYASYMRIDEANGVIEVGNILMSPALQRTAAATEAMYLMARHVFEDLGYRRYEWKCNALNEPSRRAALRYGFTFEGIFRQHMVIKSQNRDTAWFSMLDKEWPARKRAFEAWLGPANFDADGQQIKSLTDIAGAQG
jgi:RimJ/RimL family protein N-acetyltransferase